MIDWENTSGGGDVALQGKDQLEGRHHGSTQITLSRPHCVQRHGVKWDCYFVADPVIRRDIIWLVAYRKE